MGRSVPLGAADYERPWPGAPVRWRGDARYAVRVELRQQLPESSPANTGSAGPVKVTSSSSPTATSSSPPSSLTEIGLARAVEHRRHGGAARARPGRHRLPHPALVDPRSDGAAVDAGEGHVGAVREQLVVLDPGADRCQVEVLDLVPDLDHALRVADRDVPEAPLAVRRPRARRCRPRSRTGSRPSAVLARPIAIAHDVARGDPGPDLAGDGVDRELVRVGPPRPAQVQRRLARPVARTARPRSRPG